ncbi:MULTISPECIES: right-handed parallel beta-helix repeat-containing protein [Burkholderia]|uniref:right-handed parallel beta-helix repeat-containing protein n=1 Tax=Burkholderia TaxID=32008 RepID=UPI000841FEF1|nr:MULTISPECIES: right-handed parallel beta-helix repeat-containing protein [unclassified Burkholderia]AOK31986.1 hypothetical protein AQ611_21095 [Burkholderia sp. Bp7605]
MTRSLPALAALVAALSVAAAGQAAQPAAPAPLAAALPDVTLHPTGDNTDQADTIQRALDSLQAGQRLVFAPGQYVVGRSLVVKTLQAVVSGYGATLIATNDADQTIEMRGQNSTLVGVTLVGTGTTRLATPSSTKVDVEGSGIQVLDVTIRGGASAGIFVFSGADVAVVGNTVQDTLADGIHTTHGSRNVLVRDNTVKNTGDDMVAVVSYIPDGKMCSNVLIQNNKLLGNYWGRGATVVGGADVTITGNTVQNVEKAAGILVAQEDSWNTYNSTNVVVSNNDVSNIELPNPNNPRDPAYMGGIELNTWPSGKVTRVSVTGNRVSRTHYQGLRTLGNVCDVNVSGNAFASINDTPIALLQAAGCSASQLICQANTLDGNPLPPPPGCSTTGSISVTGANVSRMPIVREYLRQASTASVAKR